MIYMIDMIGDSVRREVYDRDNGRCVVCYTPGNLERTPHHCFLRSQYHEKDKDLAWNLVTICIECHKGVHYLLGDKPKWEPIREDLKHKAVKRRLNA